MNNKLLIILFGLLGVCFVLFLLILNTKYNIKKQNIKNQILEQKALHITNLKSRYNEEHQTAIQSMMKESSVHKKTLGKKTSFKVFNIKFNEFDRLANKVLNSSMIIESILIVRKNKDQVDLTIVGVE